MRAEKGDSNGRARGANLKDIGDTDRLVKSNLQRGSASVLSVALPLGNADKHELREDRLQVTAISGMASELAEVSLMKPQ